MPQAVTIASLPRTSICRRDARGEAGVGRGLPGSRPAGDRRHPDVQDRDRAEELLRHTCRRCPFIEVIFADGGYQGPIMAERVAKTGRWPLEIVKRNDVPRSEVVPKRWIVERTLARISHFRCLARDFQRNARSLVAFARLAMIRIMLRRLTVPLRFRLSGAVLSNTSPRRLGSLLPHLLRFVW